MFFDVCCISDIVKDRYWKSSRWCEAHRWWVMMVLDSRFIWYVDGYLTKQSIRYPCHPNNLHSISLKWEFEVYSHVEIPSFLKGFISSSFFFGSRLLADYKMEAQLIIPPVIGGLPCHCWPSRPCSPASEFHLCWISKALSKSPRFKEKKLVNYIMQLENPSFINVHEHSPFRKLVDFFPARKIHRADDFPSFACPEFHEARRRMPGWFPNEEDQISPWLVGWLNHPIWNILIRQNGWESSPS